MYAIKLHYQLIIALFSLKKKKMNPSAIKQPAQASAQPEPTSIASLRVRILVENKEVGTLESLRTG